MSDTRFILLGVGFIFAGFLVLGAFGSQYGSASVEAREFDDCYEYFEDMPPRETDCEGGVLQQSLFFALIIGLIAAGVISLVKGARGSWDQKVGPEDMVGPGRGTGDSGNDGSEKSG